VTEAPSDDVEQEQENDDEAEPARVTTYKILYIVISFEKPFKFILILFSKV